MRPVSRWQVTCSRCGGNVAPSTALPCQVELETTTVRMEEGREVPYSFLDTKNLYLAPVSRLPMSAIGKVTFRPTWS